MRTETSTRPTHLTNGAADVNGNPDHRFIGPTDLLTTGSVRAPARTAGAAFLNATTSHTGSAFLLHVERWLRWASFALFWLATALVAAMMIHIVLDVVLKYAFNRPLPMTVEMVAHYYMVAVVFLPMPLVELRNAGVSVDLFYRMFGQHARRGIMLLAYLGQIAFFGILAYQSGLDALEAMKARKFVYLDFRLDTWPAAFFLPAGFALATLVSMLRFVQVTVRSDWEHVVELKMLDEPSAALSPLEKR
jgi:TRAP-type C4-dicarboxylate transport system permease small subunit